MSDNQSLKSKGLSIGDFAEQLIQKDSTLIKEGKKSPIPSVNNPAFGLEEPKDQPDIRQINLEDDYHKRILAESFGENVEEDTTLVHRPRRQLKLVESKKSERTPEDILDEFIFVVEKGKELIQEMTTVGMLGVNLGGPEATKSKKKKKKTRSLDDWVKKNYGRRK